MKNILFISSALRYFDSSASNRNIGLVKALSLTNNVYSIEYVSTNTRIPLVDIPLIGEQRIEIDNYRVEFEHSDQPNSGVISKLNTLVRKRIKILLRDRLFSIFSKKDLHDKVSSFKVNFDIVITSSDPVGVHWQFLISSLRKNPNLKDCKYIQYWGDPLVGDINNEDNIFLRYLEKKLLSNADLVCWVSSATLKVKKQQYNLEKEKFFYLPRMIDVGIIDKDKISINLKKGLKIVYAGDFHSKSRDISTLIEFFKKNKDHSLTIIGDGDTYEEMPENVRIFPRRPKIECDNFINEADIVIILSNKNGSQIPGKVFELAPTDKFVIVLDHEGLAKNIFPFKNRFVFCENNLQDITNFFSQETVECSHDFEEYDIGARVIEEIING